MKEKHNKILHNKSHKAFSLMEISIVILLLGILTLGISYGVDLYTKSKVSMAVKLTDNSIVGRLSGLSFWLETSKSTSIKSSEAVDGGEISVWYDNNPTTILKNNAYAGQKTDSSLPTYNFATGSTAANTKGPTYLTKGINGLPSLRFVNQGSTLFNYMVVDKNAIQQLSGLESFSMFVVFNYVSGSGNIVDRSCVKPDLTPATACDATAWNAGKPYFSMQFSDDGQNKSITYYIKNNSGTYYGNSPFSTDSAIFSNYAEFSKNISSPMMLTFLRNLSGNSYDFPLYLNGKSNPEVIAGSLSGAMSLHPIKIGRHAMNSSTLEMQVSEVIFFTERLSDSNRQAVEDYLGKKYSIPISR